MGEVKKINIINRGYYFHDNMVNIKNFHSNFLKINKKSHEDIDIYYICYITIKKFSDCMKIITAKILFI